MYQGVLYALLAAALFGASTPFAKQLIGDVPPVLLAGLLYAGSGTGLACIYLIQRARGIALADLSSKDLPWLGGAILAGGVVAPVLLLYGLTLTAASTASLLLNLESVLTAILAWWVFRENYDRRIAVGMWAIVAGSVLLSWNSWNGVSGDGAILGPVVIAAACLCWSIDNNLTRKVSASDAVQIACLKGLVAGSVNLGVAIAMGSELPALQTAALAATLGFIGYGLSLVLFVLALRHLGTARSGAYFSLAPFVGAVLSLVMLGDRPGPLFWVAGVLMAIGLWLHLTESHGHEHDHEPMEHAHSHRHDKHHQHQHGAEWDGREPHVHPHIHMPLRHKHPHFPDIHHRHDH
ncbi:EamA family transporter [Massilia sp. DJPM01]|uniref:DMT family transporter n=1 Tax=Massilia sp. DJPM01 TaxID=3024404 RepID=UPI00259F578C|nr:DMT family transporter [Massilia sp. DJPM01]MDM5181338.1 EamA family transporter [Massilia sp. DJPM01]